MSQTLVLSNSSLASAGSGSGSSCRGAAGGRTQREKDEKNRNTDKEREARSVALEKAYVHDVYEQISGGVGSSSCFVRNNSLFTFHKIYLIFIH